MYVCMNACMHACKHACTWSNPRHICMMYVGPMYACMACILVSIHVYDVSIKLLPVHFHIISNFSIKLIHLPGSRPNIDFRQKPT